MTERELILVLNSQRWKSAPCGWAISVDGCTIEARKERRQWRARAKSEENWTNWTSFVDTRWRAGLMARAALFSPQLSLDLELAED